MSPSQAWMQQLQHVGSVRISTAKTTPIFACLTGAVLLVVGLFVALSEDGGWIIAGFLLIVALFLIGVGIRLFVKPTGLTVARDGVTVEGGKATSVFLPWAGVYETTQWRMKHNTGLILGVAPELEAQYVATLSGPMKASHRASMKLTKNLHGIVIPNGLEGGQEELLAFLNQARLQFAPAQYDTTGQAQQTNQYPGGSSGHPPQSNYGQPGFSQPQHPGSAPGPYPPQPGPQAPQGGYGHQQR